MTPPRKYVVDTNLFVRSMRETDAARALQRFHTVFTPFEYLSAIVVHELSTGARGARMEKLQRYLFDTFERRGRIVTPSYDAWKRAGAALAELAAGQALDRHTLSRGFTNDVLLAASCREAGVVLVTENVRDFARIARVLPFDFVAPWPTATS